MPLINNHQVKQNLERSQDVIKVVITITICVEVGIFQFDIAAEFSIISGVSTVAICGGITAFHFDQITEQFHTHNGVYVVQHL